MSMRDHSTADYERFSAGVVILLAVCAVWIVATRWVAAWYERGYGRVTQSARQKRLGAALVVAGAASFLVPFEAEIVTYNAGVTLPINVMLLGLSAWVVVYWLYLGRAFRHYLAIAACGLILAVLSLAGVPANGFVSHVREALLFMGLASVAGGVIDHRILSRALWARNVVGVDS